jgi:hypothetical protein
MGENPSTNNLLSPFNPINLIKLLSPFLAPVISKSG